jgi:hypothetical protein
MSGLPRGMNRCKHIKVNGTRCKLPALRDLAYCYFHYRHRQRESTPAGMQVVRGAPAAGSGEAAGAMEAHGPGGEGWGPPAAPADLFFLEDANAIQCAVEWVLRRILDGSLEHRQAALLLHGLEIAAGNVKLTNFDPSVSDLARSLPAEQRR